jgi:hypothetical protein
MMPGTDVDIKKIFLGIPDHFIYTYLVNVSTFIPQLSGLDVYGLTDDESIALLISL